MTELWQTLKNTRLPIYLYGMGNGADKIINTLDTMGIAVSGVFVSDGFVRDKTFHGFKLQSYSDVKNKHENFIVLVSFGTSLNDVISNIKRIGSEQTLFAPDLPVFGDGLFTLDFCRQNAERIKCVYNALADDISKTTFEKLIRYKITGDVSFLFDCETRPDEPFKNFLNLRPDSVFVDLGAYRGDTLAEFIKNVGGFKKAYAVEPDKKTFEKLKKAVPENVFCINAAASDREGVSYFEMQSGRGSHLSGKGIEIPCVSVDSLFCKESVDYIKMDVEGAESKAITGSVKTIQSCKPKLCIAAYHRAYDLIDIPEQILEIRPDYKMYLRHFPYIPAWDTNYYFI
ncbi:MAG: FkbM family methyltransferase [Clostridia bacterium]|nr:FkbM family methyltransferase [Clostridia bacterium]